MVRASVVAGLLLLGMGACARGPGTLSGQLDGMPFELRTATIYGGTNQLVIEAHDQPNGCTTKPKRGRLVRIVLQSPPTEGIPQPRVYALADAGVPGVTVARVRSNEFCAEINTLHARAAEVELVEVVVDPPNNTFEADLRLRLTFQDEVLEGSVHATTCHTSAMACDSD